MRAQQGPRLEELVASGARGNGQSWRGINLSGGGSPHFVLFWVKLNFLGIFAVRHLPVCL